ncbi:replication initiation protein [Clostridium oceanicum]|uniref:Initiator Rep protein WH1 domain-containing protein n=1 Tax=Clostridium oceanicum TaxID=1543 RepID=A0ABN1JXR9_9CLOT
MIDKNQVTKANDLNLRAYKLSRIEQLFLLSVISLVQPTDEDFKTYKINIKDFINLLSLKGKSKYCDLPKITKSLMTKVIEIKRSHSLLQVCWFSSVEHKTGEGIIEVEFSPKLKPYLLNLKNNFVSYSLNQVSNLSSKYSIRIYELLRQFSYQKTVKFNLEEFRLLIGIDSGEYPRYSNLKQRVLNKSKKEISKKTDIDFNFEEIKSGRKVIGIKFYINKNKNNKAVDEIAMSLDSTSTENEIHKNNEKNYIEKVKSIIKEPIDSDDAHKIYKASNGNLSLIEKIYEKSKKYDIDSIVAFMISGVKSNYKDDIKSVKKDHFNDFDQRTYDFEDLEKKLLGIK